MEGIKRDNNVFKICNVLIFLGVIFLPFANLKFAESIPSLIKILLSYEDFVSQYFFLAFVIVFLGYKISKKELRDYKTICLFFLLFLTINCFIEIRSTLLSPYIKNANYSLLEGSSLVLFNLIKRIMRGSDFTCYVFMSIIKCGINITKSFISTFFFAYSFYLYYRDTKGDYMHDIWKATTISVGYILMFEIIEFSHLLGANWAKELDITIFSILYDVEGTHGWWPPAIWDRVRSVFPEPSYFAYWGSVSLFILLYGILKNKKRALSSIEFFLLAFTLFATDSRTGSLLLLGGLVVFLIFFLFGEFKKNITMAILVTLLIIIPMALASLFLSLTSGFVGADSKGFSLLNFVNSTITSIEGTEARSNMARYGLRDAQIEIFKRNPLLGVGETQIGNYESDNFPEYTKDDEEIKTWISAQNEVGPFENAIPRLNEYTYTLAAKGLLGFLVEPGVLLLISILLSISYLKKRENDTDQAIVITLCALMVAFGLSNAWITNFIYIVVLSLSYSKCTQIIDTKWRSQ